MNHKNKPSLGESVAARAADEIEHYCARGVDSGLFVVSTPIGNLADITLRALGVLNGVDLILAEDTRHSRTLLTHFGIETRLRPYHEHNAERERPQILDALSAGQSIALISDAGTPLISDPGYKLVRACLAEGHGVTAIPGASAPLAGLVSAGLPTDCFVFAGFLPNKSAGRRERIRQLASTPGTLVFFEAPSRVAACLQDLSTELGAERQACVARELTKLHEEVLHGSLAELAETVGAKKMRGEFVIVVGPGEDKVFTDDEIVARLEVMLGDESLRDAARIIAEDFRVAKSRVYDLGLRLKKKGQDGGP